MRPLSAALTLVLSASAGTGCLSEEGAGQGQALKAALAQAEQAALDTRVDAERLQTPAGWRAVVRRAFARHAGRLGATRFTLDASVELAVHEGPTLRTTEQRVTETSLNGDFTLVHRLAWSLPDDVGDDGRRCGRLGGRAYVGGDAGPVERFTERAGESDRCLEGAIEPLTAWLRAYEVDVAREIAQGPVLLGRPTVEVRLSGLVDPKAAPRGLPAFWQPNAAGTATEETMGVPGPRGWLTRTHGALRSLGGVLQLDVETGLPLGERLDAGIAVQKAGQSGELRLHVELKTETRTGALSPPAEVVDARPRPRPTLERERLLGQHFKGQGESPPALPRPGDAPPLTLVPGAEGDAPVESPASAASSPPTVQP